MTDQFKGIEPMVIKSKISVPYSWWAGETATEFFLTLRDKKKIKGRICKDCSKTYVPPRKTCPACFKETEWIDVTDEGTLEAYTVVHKKLASLPKDPPIIYGIIKLDGTDSGMLHFIDEVDPKKVKIGLRLKAKFSDEKSGTIKDIAYFRPVNS